MKESPKPKREKKINGWMISFFILIAIFLAVIITLFIKITTVKEMSMPEQTEPYFPGNVVATLTTDRDKLNALINQVIPDLQRPDTNIHFHLEDSFGITGGYQVMGFEVPFHLNFNPVAQDEGNVELQVSEFSIGSLQLPAGIIMNFISESLALPPYVLIDSQNETIIIRLDQIYFGNGLRIKANEINLASNIITFDLVLSN